ncbi:hypothetical protein GCM10010399_64180 [Dactylosporangium fulvum]|uniref:Uncharacterized protein n=1 Tax=Dactylosporangium fulvum TaxID=53359 RepID=A0ABY5W965_9ACTN|nr:hypothetical protein [Dactylosporangium fulvum]UWP85759.1 hypothetical protein Dfulv_16565 [Dactylosporangium fulvum]
MTRRVPFTDLASLKAWLGELRPADRIHTARLIADTKTRGELVQLANAEIYEHSRDHTTPETATHFGITDRAARRAISEHRKATGAEGKPPGRRKAAE